MHSRQQPHTGVRFFESSDTINMSSLAADSEPLGDRVKKRDKRTVSETDLCFSGDWWMVAACGSKVAVAEGSKYGLYGNRNWIVAFTAVCFIGGF